MAEAAVLTSLGWLASPLMKMLFDKGLNHLGTDIDKRREILAATVLPRLSLVIEKAEKSTNREKVEEWLKKLKDAYYEAEDAIDLFEYDLLKHKVKKDRKTLQRKVKNVRGIRIISLTSQFVPRRLKLASKKLKYGLSVFSRKKIMLKSRIGKLIEIAKEVNEFRDLLEPQEGVSGSDRETISEPPRKVFGREKDKEKIIGLLKKPLNLEPGPSTRQAIPIVAITGRSGVGKTTLAQYVYNYMDGPEHFDIAIWVHVPRKFKATDIITKMIENIKAKEGVPHAGNSSLTMSLETLSTQINSMLRSKKFLLVLDDFWCGTEDDREQWDKFIRCLKNWLPESRILLATQSDSAARKTSLVGVTELSTYCLPEIEEGQFLELFMHHAWPSNCHLKKEEFEKIACKIAAKLKGDPGAAKIVGYQLREKLDLKHWEEIAEKDWLGDNMNARIWSYQQLPVNLQRCFAMLSLFPRGTQFPKPLLIDLWMAEGFIKPKDKKEGMEDIAENYLHELLSRFFLEQYANEEGQIIIYLHDLFHDLAKRVQGDDFVTIEHTNSGEIPPYIHNMLSQSENIRHISLPANMITELKDKLCIMKNLYTLCVDDDNSIIPKKVLQEILKNLGKLRVIYLPWYVDDLPDCIGNLKHLRYLNIGGSLPVKKLPGSICKLYHLQTLVLPSCESVPKNFCELISLRRFSTDRETISHISDVGRLTSLQSISQFVVKKEPGHELHQLENLIQLRGKMCITGLENVANIEDAVKANMQIKKHLEGLELEWKSDERATEAYRVLDALQPHPNISSLKITSYGGNKFPGWLVGQNSLRHLKSLELVGCSKVEEIPSIEESLPSCKFLTLGVLNNLKELPTLPLDLKSLTVNWIPQVSYFSENDLLMKEKRKQSLLEVLKQIAECPLLDLVPLSEEIKPTVRKVLQLVKESLNTAPKICITSSLCGDIFSKIERINPWSNDYSMEQLLDALVMCMQYHLETMLSKNEESRLVLPSSLTFLWIASCSITSDALSSCIQSLVFLSELKLSEIQTITSLPPKEVLCALKNLCSLTIDRCLLLCSLGGIGALTSLTELQLNGCLNLNASNEPLPSSLEKLEFWGCVNADIILAKSNLPVLDVLVVDYCGQLSKEQERVLHVSHLSSIKELHIMNWKGHLEGLNSLTSLYQLSLVNCPEINRSSPVEKYSSRLEIVLVDNPLLLKLMLSDETLSSIEMLSIFMNRGNYLDDDVFPYLTSLTYLLFYECNITHLPKNLKNLSSLFHLELQHCPNLCELEDLPQNLCELKIKDCPTLTDRFKKGGPYRVRFEEGSTMFEFRSSFRDISN